MFHPQEARRYIERLENLKSLYPFQSIHVVVQIVE